MCGFYQHVDLKEQETFELAINRMAIMRTAIMRTAPDHDGGNEEDSVFFFNHVSFPTTAQTAIIRDCGLQKPQDTCTNKTGVPTPGTVPEAFCTACACSDRDGCNLIIAQHVYNTHNAIRDEINRKGPGKAKTGGKGNNNGVRESTPGRMNIFWEKP